MSTPLFQGFGKVARFSREAIITEKIDGTNAQIHIVPFSELLIEIDPRFVIAGKGPNIMFAASRTQYITPESDNHGFATWAKANSEELFQLGVGRHYGEWWGSGIQRGYGLTKGEKRFSLFNTHRWANDGVDILPRCCNVVPVIASGILETGIINDCLRALKEYGSFASHGFMKPEGIMIYHTAGNVMFKKTLERDDERKGG